MPPVTATTSKLRTTKRSADGAQPASMYAWAAARLALAAIFLWAFFDKLIGLALVGAGRVLGFGETWARLRFVQRQPWLQ